VYQRSFIGHSDSHKIVNFLSASSRQSQPGDYEKMWRCDVTGRDWMSVACRQVTWSELNEFVATQNSNRHLHATDARCALRHCKLRVLSRCTLVHDVKFDIGTSSDFCQLSTILWLTSSTSSIALRPLVSWLPDHWIMYSSWDTVKYD